MDSVTWSVWHNSVMGILSVIGGFGLICWSLMFMMSDRWWQPFACIVLLLAGILLAFHGIDHIHLAYLTNYFKILFPS